MGLVRAVRDSLFRIEARPRAVRLEPFPPLTRDDRYMMRHRPPDHKHRRVEGLERKLTRNTSLPNFMRK